MEEETKEEEKDKEVEEEDEEEEKDKEVEEEGEEVKECVVTMSETSGVM